MWNLIKRNFQQRIKLLYLFNAILILYVIGVSLSCKYEQLMPSINFLPSLGTAVNFITAMIIILAALSFSGKRAHQQISKFLMTRATKINVFWSKIIVLLIQYLELAAVTFIFSILTQRIIFHGKYLIPNTAHVIYVMGTTISGNFIYSSLLVSATILFSNVIKSAAGTMAASFGLQYLGEIPMGGFMILVYHHRWLKFNPFNFLFVQNQIVKPINHTMSKISMVGAVVGSIFYTIIFLLFAYLAFIKNSKQTKINHR